MQRRQFLKRSSLTGIGAGILAGCLDQSGANIVLSESLNQGLDSTIEHTFTVEQSGKLVRNEEESNRLGPEILFDVTTGGNVEPLSDLPFRERANLFPSSHEFVQADRTYTYLTFDATTDAGGSYKIELELETEDGEFTYGDITPSEALQQDKEEAEQYVEYWLNDDREGPDDAIPRVIELLRTKAASFDTNDDIIQEVINYCDAVLEGDRPEDTQEVVESGVTLDISQWEQIDRGTAAFYEVINETDRRAVAVPMQLGRNPNMLWAHNIPPQSSNQYPITIADDLDPDHLYIRQRYVTFEDDIGRQVEADAEMTLVEDDRGNLQFEIAIPEDVELSSIRDIEINGYHLVSEANTSVMSDAEAKDNEIIVVDPPHQPYYEFTSYEPPLSIRLASATEEQEFTAFPRRPEFDLDVSQVEFSETSDETILDTVSVEVTAKSDIPALGGTFGVLQEQQDQFIFTQIPGSSKPGGLFFDGEEGYVAEHPIHEELRSTIIAENILESGQPLVTPATGEERVGKTTTIDITVNEALDLPVNEDTRGFVIFQWGATVLAFTSFSLVDHLE